MNEVKATIRLVKWFEAICFDLPLCEIGFPL